MSETTKDTMEVILSSAFLVVFRCFLMHPGASFALIMNCSLQAESCGDIKGIHAKSLHLTSFGVLFMFIFNVLLEDFVR